MTTDAREPQPVEIVGEPAYRVVLERNISTEFQITRRDMAEWPDDERAQRAWCLDRVLAAKTYFSKDDDGVAAIAQAELFRAYINNTNPEVPQ